MTKGRAKRECSLISNDPGLKSCDGYGKSVDSGGDGDLHSMKHKGVEVENVVNKKSRQSDEENDSSLLWKGKEACGLLNPYAGIISSQESITSAMSNMPREVQEKCNLVNDSVATQSVLELVDASRDSSQSTISVPAYPEFNNSDGNSQDEEKVPLDATPSNCVSEGLAASISRSEDFGAGKLGSSNYGSVDWLKLPKSLGSKVFSLERCTWDSVEGNINLNDPDGALKSCTCSFCLKAAYIWSDLHYQDIKGRITALKKSQKEASALVRNGCEGREFHVHGEGNSGTSSKLESDLTGQWKSLFLNMEDVLNRESNQLEAGFVKLKELREKCKMDLETVNVMPSDKQ